MRTTAKKKERAACLLNNPSNESQKLDSLHEVESRSRSCHVPKGAKDADASALVFRSLTGRTWVCGTAGCIPAQSIFTMLYNLTLNLDSFDAHIPSPMVEAQVELHVVSWADRILGAFVVQKLHS